MNRRDAAAVALFDVLCVVAFSFAFSDGCEPVELPTLEPEPAP